MYDPEVARMASLAREIRHSFDAFPYLDDFDMDRLMELLGPETIFLMQDDREFSLESRADLVKLFRLEVSEANGLVAEFEKQAMENQRGLAKIAKLLATDDPVPGLEPEYLPSRQVGGKKEYLLVPDHADLELRTLPEKDAREAAGILTRAREKMMADIASLEDAHSKLVLYGVRTSDSRLERLNHIVLLRTVLKNRDESRVVKGAVLHHLWGKGAVKTLLADGVLCAADIKNMMAEYKQALKRISRVGDYRGSATFKELSKIRR